MAEKRLIDANALFTRLQKRREDFADGWKTLDAMPINAQIQYHENLECALIVEDAPTVDAVEVVRCHECKKWDQETWFCEEHSTFRHNGLEWDMFNPNDFCSYGESNH